MRFKIIAFALLFLTVCVMSSCLNSDDTETVVYDDTAITSVTLGTLKYYRTTKSSKGTDSIYSGTVTGSKYAVYIDQKNHRIYNVDSLPVGTDMQHVLITVATKNSGTAVIKSMTSDSIFVISSTDSLDFSVPREVYAYSNSGINNVKYTVDLVAHKEYAAAFHWNQVATVNDIAAYKNVKSKIFGDKIYVIGATSNGAELISSSLSDGKNWSKVTSFPATLTADASIIADENCLMIADAEKIYTTTDGESWSTTDAVGVKALAGICGKEVFAISNSSDMLVSYDGGKSWMAEFLDDSKDNLPVSDFSFCSEVTTTNKDIRRAILVGSRNELKADADTSAVVWSKIVEDDSKYDLPWAYQAFKNTSKYKLPNLTNLSMIPYGEYLLAIGGKGKNGSSAEAYANIYRSEDCGITWHIDDERFVIPSGFSAESAAIVTDGKGYIWIIATGSGQIWRGYLNEVVWQKPQGFFYE